METLAWEKLEQYIGGSAPVLLAMGGTRNVRIGFEPSANKLFLRVPLLIDEIVPATPFSELELEEKQEIDSTHRVLEVFTCTSHLFRDFHRLAGLLTEDFESSDKTATESFLTVVERWRELITTRNILTEDEQIGLIGELLILEALINKHGLGAIESWTGRMKELPERHDFRIFDIDLEIKTTRRNNRQHVIHGLRQLQPSSGHNLFLVSVKLERAGMNNGVSLADRVDIIRKMVASNYHHKEIFETKLVSTNYRDSDEIFYMDRYILSDEIYMIAVDANFPCLTPQIVNAAVGSDLAARIDNDVVYRITVDGLGYPISQSDKASMFGKYTEC